MTVAELRKALEGLPDDMPIAYKRDERLYTVVSSCLDKCSTDTWHLKGDHGDDLFHESEGDTHFVIS